MEAGTGEEYGEITGNHGLGNSEHAVIVPFDHAAASFILAAEKKTGATIWRIEREKRVAWTSPVVVREGTAKRSSAVPMDQWRRTTRPMGRGCGR